MSLEVRGLRVTVGGHRILDGVDLDVGDGERVGLVGASGSGKSLLARSLVGLQPSGASVAGSIFLGGEQVVGASEERLVDLRGRAVGMVFQNPGAALSPVTRIGDQVALPLRLHYDLTHRERRRRAQDMLRRVGLGTEVMQRYPGELSGGQQQRVCIAAALICSPRLIIADEPTTALDSLIQRDVIDLLVSLVDDLGASLLLITHDYAVLSRAVTRCHVLSAGRIVEEGPVRTLMSSPASEEGRVLSRAARLLTLRPGGDEDADARDTDASDGAGASRRPLLTARGLAVDLGRGRGRRRVLHGADLSLFPGECLAVVGGSGSGKTTLVRALLGLTPAAAGEVTYRGLAVSGRRSPGSRALRHEAGLVFQNPLLALDPRWPLGRSVAEPLRMAGWRDSDWIATRVRWAMSAAGLDADVFSPRYPADVSGGQAQRAVIARALVLKPRVVVADEPMSSLDVVARMRLIDALDAIRRVDSSMALLIVSHDLGVVRRLADHIVVLHDGRIEEDGDARDVLRSPHTDYACRLVAAATLTGARAPGGHSDRSDAEVA